MKQEKPQPFGPYQIRYFMFPRLPDVTPVHCISQHRFTTKKNDLFEQWYTCNYKLSYILREKVFDRFDPHGKVLKQKKVFVREL